MFEEEEKPDLESQIKEKELELNKLKNTLKAKKEEKEREEKERRNKLKKAKKMHEVLVMIVENYRRQK
jgi:hypothetical protein